MRFHAEQAKAADRFLPGSSFSFATIIGINEEERLLKVVLEPYGNETGWCRVLKDTFYPIPKHKDHPDPDGKHTHDEHDPQWPYKPGQEVLVGAITGMGHEQYVVLGLIDQGAVSDQ
ncbi:hypothetical protein [Brevibacillus laterosporus]|uniref:hypothetical protein n=1 Tax=Brevibacillus laterosporus TaxID=1465 RepID=UPI0018CED442|nr:hypothetical protein [Brevibacillus laterosporus]MBG9786949.1 hypothetical protein [Brevibacillus laterosporus]